MNVLGFDNMSYEVKCQIKSYGVAHLGKEPDIFKDIHLSLHFTGVQSLILISKVKVDLRGKV